MAGRETNVVRVASPWVFPFQAGSSMRAAEHPIWSTPAECSPEEIPGMLVTSYRSLVPLMPILRCLAATDLAAVRRENLAQIRTGLDSVPGRLRVLCPAPR